MKLENKILDLKNSKIKKAVDKRLKEFKSKKSKNNHEWFSELCFCILTANSRAKTAINIQKELGAKGFIEKSQKELEKTISKNKHRFSGMKSRYIMKARNHESIKNEIKKMADKNQHEARDYLAENVLGIGYKEASHFLRNIGYFDLAILDRHILALLKEHDYLKGLPKTLTKKKYFEIEKI
ncbi:MAG: N-glycosylase/DNA lyase, partial [Candidatus Nanoarchaeia archaeon]|nr:N-glycosylase/DNA lyase [Candidatus Nanoarchaeia archaeon]